MNPPLVTVICLCYNHEKYVGDAIDSVLGQTHPNIQLIIVDDRSSDNSVDIVHTRIGFDPAIEFIPLRENGGNCKAFNRGLTRARGAYVIDLAADDVLMPNRIEKGIAALEAQGKHAGVTFSDAVLIDESGEPIGLHSDRFPHATIPQGYIYESILSRYFINSPSMMSRREVFDTLVGFDERLAYEDFDFWVRSSRVFSYCYTPEPLVKKRVLSTSLGKSQYKKSNQLMRSTLIVCEKALALNRNAAEHHALIKRVWYESRKALLAGDLQLAWQYFRLWKKIP